MLTKQHRFEAGTVNKKVALYYYPLLGVKGFNIAVIAAFDAVNVG